MTPFRTHVINLLPLIVFGAIASALHLAEKAETASAVSAPADNMGNTRNDSPLSHQAAATAHEVDRRFKQAVAMLQAGQHEHALTALHRVLQLAPAMPEAHVNMGYALLGLNRHTAARDFFMGAIELRPMQANAYYGLALALEEGADRAGAIGAMRSFVHLAKPDDPHVRKARAALWEWQAAGVPKVAGNEVAPARQVRTATSADSGSK